MPVLPQAILNNRQRWLHTSAVTVLDATDPCPWRAPLSALAALGAPILDLTWPQPGATAVPAVRTGAGAVAAASAGVGQPGDVAALQQALSTAMAQCSGSARALSEALPRALDRVRVELPALQVLVLPLVLPSGR